jgi:hypothetical protein
MIVVLLCEELWYSECGEIVLLLEILMFEICVSSKFDYTMPLIEDEVEHLIVISLFTLKS